MAGQRGFLLVVSAPSGAGKSTLTRWVLEQNSRVRLSVSLTTRSPRPGEVDGVHYHFVTQEEFQSRLAAGEFLEWAEVFGNRYGTSRTVIEGMLTAGHVVLLDIDWQGARQVRQGFPGSDVVTVFVAPPSRQALQQRLQGRGQDSPEVIRGRMAKADQEMSHWAEYDYFIINDDLEQARADLLAIVQAEGLRRHHRSEQWLQILTRFDLPPF